jgi:hypothetical protein
MSEEKLEWFVLFGAGAERNTYHGWMRLDKEEYSRLEALKAGNRKAKRLGERNFNNYFLVERTYITDSVEEMPFTGERDLYYYTYRIDCLVPETPYYYLGKHATKNLEDGYRGSGPGLLSLYKDFSENLCFKMTIIKFYLNEEEVKKNMVEAWKRRKEKYGLV